MNLYLIEVREKGAPIRIVTHFIGDSDKDVYDFLSANHWGDGIEIQTDYADAERDAFYDSEIKGLAYRERIIKERGTLYTEKAEYAEFPQYGWKLLKEGISYFEISTLINLGIEFQFRGFDLADVAPGVTRNILNKKLKVFNGYQKTDADFNKMIDVLATDYGLHMIDGEIAYNDDMTQKRYNYRLVLPKSGEEYKTIGYLSAVKYFLLGLDNPYEILAYVS